MCVLCVCRYIFADIHIYIFRPLAPKNNVRCPSVDNWAVLGVTLMLFPKRAKGLLLTTVGGGMLACGLTQSRQSPILIFFSVLIVGSKNRQFASKYKLC